MDLVKWNNELLNGNYMYKYVIDRDELDSFINVVYYYNSVPESLNCIYDYCCFKNKKDYLIWLEDMRDIKPTFTSVDNAVCGKHLDLVKWFHQRNIKGLNALFYSIMDNNVIMMEYLYNKGYRYNQEECLDWARRNDLKEAYKWMIKKGFSYQHE